MRHAVTAGEALPQQGLTALVPLTATLRRHEDSKYRPVGFLDGPLEGPGGHSPTLARRRSFAEYRKGVKGEFRYSAGPLGGGLPPACPE